TQHEERIIAPLLPQRGSLSLPTVPPTLAVLHDLENAGKAALGRGHPALSCRTFRIETISAPRRSARIDPDGIRTRVSNVKGWCPRPLDDGAMPNVNGMRILRGTAGKRQALTAGPGRRAARRHKPTATRGSASPRRGTSPAPRPRRPP